MTVTAKFIVTRRNEMGWATEVELTPDYAEGRNKEWAEATPAGTIRMTIKNELAADVFQQGTPFTVLFEVDEQAVAEREAAKAAAAAKDASG